MRNPPPSGESIEQIPTAQGGAQGRPVIDANADVAGIARATGQSVGSDLHLRFGTADDLREARRLLRATQSGRGTSDVLQVTDAAIAAEIARTASYTGAAGSSNIRFTAAGRDWTAEMIGGPGGSFLSNESAYRTQRQLANSRSTATSFHVHTQGQSADLGRLVTTLQSIVTEVITRRQAAPPTTPPPRSP
jgi:hypothetical protein